MGRSCPHRCLAPPRQICHVHAFNTAKMAAVRGLTMLAEALSSEDVGLMAVAIAGLEMIDPLLATQIDDVTMHPRRTLCLLRGFIVIEHAHCICRFPLIQN